MHFVYNFYYAAMMRKIFLILYILLLTTANAATVVQRADALFQEGAYAEAGELYSSLHKSSPKNALYTYRLARCEQELGDNENAIRHFEAAGDKYNLRNLYLGDLYYVAYRFTEAKQMYKSYLDGIGEGNERYSEVIEQIKRAERAEKMLARTEDITFIDSVSFPANELLNRIPLPKEQGTFSFTNGNFTYTNERADRRIIAVREKDSGRIVIAKQEKLLDKSWSALDTLPDIINQYNTQGYPFLLPDGVTLYYSALSNQGLGEWDIYVTRYNPSSDTWLTPQLLSIPFNSLANDYLYFIDEISETGYLLTDRQAERGVLTLYSFIPNEEKQILRDSSEQYVRDYAQLKTVVRTAEVISTEKEQNTAKKDEAQNIDQSKPQNAIPKILISGDTYYNSLDMFCSDEAKVYAQEYVNISADIEQKAAQLLSLRQSYSINKNDRQDAQTILTLEKELRQQTKLAKEKLLICRKLEVNCK